MSNAQGVKAACEALRRSIRDFLRDESDAWALLYHVPRARTNKAFQHLLHFGGKDGRAHFPQLPQNLLALVILPDWEQGIRKYANSISEVGKAVIDLLDGSSISGIDSFQFAARFLECGDPSHWPSPSAEVHHDSVKLLQGSDPVVRKTLRKVFHRNEGSELSAAPPAAQTQAHLREVLSKIDWEEERGSLDDELSKLLSKMRIATVSDVTLPGGFPAWYAVAAVLGVWWVPDGEIHKRDGRFDDFMRSWLPELAANKKEPSFITGKDPFDIRLAMDPHPKAWRASGTTRTPGSRRDNRGHR